MLKAYGSVWFEDNTAPTTGIGAARVPVKPPAGGYLASPAIGTTPGPTGLTIDTPGIYYVTCSGSFSDGTGGVTFDFYLEANGAEVAPGVHCRNVNTADSKAFAIAWILQLAAGTLLRLTVHAEAGVNRVLTVEDTSICALYIGDL